MHTKNFFTLSVNSSVEENHFLAITPMRVLAIIAFNLLMLLGMTALAQNPKNGLVSGKAVDNKGEAVPFANVLLLNVKDSSMARGAVSDIEGKFVIEKIANGKYLISVRMMGFDNYVTAPFEITNENNTFKFDDIKMADASTKLKEVVVTAQKPMIEVTNNAVVMNVASSPILTSGTTLDALSKAPGVSTDQDGKISLKGKQNVIILIDGKQTYLTGDDLTRMLQSTQAANIEKIEVIENPSAKYDAAGNAGMINIVLKRDKNLGFNGSINTGFSYGQRPKSNAGITLNYRQKKFTLFATYDYTWAERVNNLTLNRQVPVANNGGITTFDQKTLMDMLVRNNNFRFGGEYFISKTTTIGFLTTGSIGEWSSKGSSNAILSGVNLNPYDRMSTNSYVADNWKNGSANINFKHTFKKGELTADADYSNWTRKGTQDIPNRFFKGNEEVAGSNIQNGAATQTNIIIKSFKVDYTLPLNNGINLEMGAKTGFVNTDNTLDATLKENGQWTPDVNRSNTFEYSENINAVYLNGNKKLNKQWNVQAGLRLEHTNFEGYSPTMNQRNKQDYVSLFPSMSVSYSPNDKNKVSVSYSRRIDRPSYSNLNPFIMYLDKYTYNKGNPFLNPQFTNTIGMTYGYNNFLFLSLNYSRTDQSMSQVLGVDLERQAGFQTMANLNLSENYSANISAPIPVAKWWLVNLNLTSFFNRNELPQDKILSQLAFQSNVTNIINLPYNIKFEVMGFYQSPMVYSVFEMEQQYKVDLGLSTSFMNNQLRLKASFTDLFNTFQFKAKTNQPNINNDVTAKWETQIFRINATYTFGNKEMKPNRRRTTSSEDLQQRANDGGNGGQ
jgi:hypothetical protein